jgi:hypothetical protein
MTLKALREKTKDAFKTVRIMPISGPGSDYFQGLNMRQAWEKNKKTHRGVIV